MLNKMLLKFMVDKPPILGNKILGNKKAEGEKGFTILEVLVTILVISGFLLGSLQATVLATLFRVQAQDKQEAANWIQQDLELIKYRAFALDIEAPFNPPNPDVTPTKANGCGNYRTRLQNILPSIPTPVPISSNPIRNYTVTRTYNNTTSDVLTINYTVAYASSHPRFKTGTGANNTIAILSTEVLPNAALTCP
jgi:prepilin-type N-terminal cleavage/methylation domain-containing protein